MQTDKIFDIIYPISILSVLLIIPMVIYARSNQRIQVSLLLTCSYVLLDLAEYCISPMLIRNYHNNWPLLNLNLILETLTTLSLFYIQFKQEKKIQTSVIGTAILLITVYLYNLHIVSYSLFASLSTFRTINSIILGILSLIFIYYILNKKRFEKRDKSKLFFAIAICIYFVPNWFFTLTTDSFRSGNLSSHVIEGSLIILCILNMIRNIMLAFFVLQIRKKV